MGIEYLRKTVEYHAKRYYDDDKPEISDFEYDMLMVELRNLENEYPDLITKDSLTQKCYSDVNKELINHAKKILVEGYYTDEAKRFFYGCLLFNLVLYISSLFNFSTLFFKSILQP